MCNANFPEMVIRILQLAHVIKKRRKLKEEEFTERESLLKFIEFLVFHILLTLLIIEVVIRREEVSAELTNTTQAAASYLNFVFLSFDVDLKLLWTGKIGVTVLTARPWSFSARSSD